MTLVHSASLRPVEPTSGSSDEWRAIETAPDKTLVMTKIDDGHGVRNEQALRRIGRLWFTPDGQTYVYYTPTHWAPLPWRRP